MNTRLTAIILAFFLFAVGLVAMPVSFKQKIPIDSVRNFLMNNELQLGLDLAGGAQLDFEVDMSRVEEKRAKGESITDQEVLNGIVSVIKNRIDPNGTRNISVTTADFGGEKHIFVGLTADIDNAETRRKLEKYIDLQFKERKTEPDGDERAAAQKAALKIVADIRGGKTSAVAIAQAEKKQDARFEIVEKKNKAIFRDELPDAAQESVWNGTGFIPEVFESNDGFEGSLIYTVREKKEGVRTITTKGEPFAIVAEELLGKAPTIINISEFKEEQKNRLLKEVKPYGVSNIFGNEGVFSVYQLLPATEKSGGVRVSSAKFTDEKKAEELVRRTQQASVEKKEQQIIADEIFLKTVPSLWKETGLDGQYFKIAKVSTSGNGFPVTSLEFDDEGAKRFTALTERLVGQPMAIFVGGKKISAPIIRERISGGAAIITGNESSIELARKNATALARDINAGAIPAPISLVGELKIAPSLGVEALKTAGKAALVGLVLLTLFMLMHYRLLGGVAIISLFAYGVIIFFIMKFFTAFVLTLAGIAGLILSIGMAVDANVLIFERMREEFAKGRTYAAALSIGFDRAWTSIWAGNMTTLLVCLILWMSGTSVIKSFAIMLGIGVALSMFTAVFVSRVILRLFSGTVLSQKKNLLLPPMKIPLSSKRR